MDSANEFQRLKLFLEEAQRKFDNERKLVEEAQRRLETERNERKLQEERARKAEDQISPTTFSQYLRYCHEFLYQHLEVQLDPSRSSGGGTTDVTGRYYPLFLRPWDNFTQTQRHHFEVMRDVLGDEQLFPSRSGVIGLRDHAEGNPVASEDDLKPFEQYAVEVPVRNIVNALGAKAGTHRALQPFNLSSISFTNHSYSVSGEYGEAEPGDVGGDRENHRGRSPTKKPAYGTRKMYPNRRCIREDRSGSRTTAFVIEYKAAPKVRPEQLRQSLSVKDLVMEVIRRTISTKSSADPDGREKVDRLVAMILTQTFDYMIGFGLEYSYLTAGKSLIFLRIKEDDPRILYYALVTPSEKNSTGDEAAGEFETAIAQVASFCLLALQSSKRTEAWVTAAQNSLCQWPIPYPEMECETSAEEETAEQASQSSDRTFESPSTASIPSREITLRSRSSCNPGLDHHGGRGDSENEDDPSSRHPLTTPGRPRARSKRKEAPTSDSARSRGRGGASVASGAKGRRCA